MKNSIHSVVRTVCAGGTLAKTLLTPAVIYPVTKDMRIFQEEQFGPVVPVATYSDITEVHTAIRDSWNGQQASVFTKDGESAAPLVDLLANTVCRININCQCGRSPDVIPVAWDIPVRAVPVPLYRYTGMGIAVY